MTRRNNNQPEGQSSINLPVGVDVGAGIAEGPDYLAGWRRRVGETNLRLCFPDLDDAARTRLLKAHFRGIGRVSLQETVSWWGSRDEVMRMTRLAVLEHLTPHLGKPLILFAPHFLGVTIGGVRLTTEYAPMVTLNARIKNPRIHQLVFQGRIRFGASEVYERSAGIKPVLRAIKKGLPFYYPPEMDFGRRDAVFVPLFGVPAATITGLSRIARATGARRSTVQRGSHGIGGAVRGAPHRGLQLKPAIVIRRGSETSSSSRDSGQADQRVPTP